MRTIIALSVLMLPLSSLSQSLTYSDADNSSEAVGLIKGTVIASQTVLAECTRRFPDQASEMRSNLAIWQKQEAGVIAKVEYFWAEMKREDARLGEMEAQLASGALNQFELLEKAWTLGDKSQPQVQVVRQYCGKYFRNLASGVWRARTPKAYRYMDDAPKPPG